MTKIVVTGAAGQVGSEVVRALLARGMEVVGADYKPGRVQKLFGGQATEASFDFSDPQSWPGTLSQGGAMFLMRPPAMADVQQNLSPLIGCARHHGITHIVFLSVAGAQRNPLLPHRQVEKRLEALGPDHTFLRPGFFAQNLESAYRQDIVQDDRIYVPAGRTQPVNWIDVRDIATLTALIFEDPTPHKAKHYTLAGPEPVSWEHVAGLLTKELGRDIRYEPASILGYVRHLLARDLPLGAVAIQTLLHVLLRTGQGALVDPTLARLLGRRPTDLATYIHDRRAVWAS